MNILQENKTFLKSASNTNNGEVSSDTYFVHTKYERAMQWK